MEATSFRRVPTSSDELDVPGEPLDLVAAHTLLGVVWPPVAARLQPRSHGLEADWPRQEARPRRRRSPTRVLLVGTAPCTMIMHRN